MVEILYNGGKTVDLAVSQILPFGALENYRTNSKLSANWRVTRGLMVAALRPSLASLQHDCIYRVLVQSIVLPLTASTSAGERIA